MPCDTLCRGYQNMATPTAIVAYLALFAGVAGLFLFVNLLVGRFLRPNLPNEEKLEVYECGEPVIGSSFVQFDLRFYVVALLFIIFDVEIAFFFPWATVFGKATQLTSPEFPIAAVEAGEPGPAEQLSTAAAMRFQELGAPPIMGPDGAEGVRRTAEQLAWISFADIALFFAVLLVGFAYVWKRGDLDWVRATSNKGEIVQRTPPRILTERATRSGSSVLSAP